MQYAAAEAEEEGLINKVRGNALGTGTSRVLELVACVYKYSLHA
jgi:hypothetical protein